MLFMTTSDPAHPGPYYHGTRADLRPGALIAPGFNSNYGARKPASWVYMAATLEAAIWGAELAIGDGRERISVVEPTGPMEDDPNLRASSSPATQRGPTARASRSG